MEELFLSAQASEMVKTNDSTREYDGDLRKVS